MVVHLGFAEQVEAARDGWLQGRYYSEEGDTVADFLSFRSVFDINPFVVGVSYARERRVYAAWRKEVDRLLDVRELMGRAFTSLSNGEMRRVLFARALLKGPRKLVVEDPYGGLDVAHRARMREVLGELRARGVEVVFCNGQDARCPSGIDVARPPRPCGKGEGALATSREGRSPSYRKRITVPVGAATA